MHSFDPQFPFAPNAPTVPAASVDDYRQIQRRLGTSRTIVVGPSMYGFDNRCTLQAVKLLGSQARGIVTLSPDTAAAEIARMHDQGARGFRFNLHRSKTNSIDTLTSIAALVAPFGWHAQVMVNANQLVEYEPYLRDLPTPLVLDHLARLPEDGSRTHPAYDVVRKLLSNGNTWMKLSLATGAQLLGTSRQAEMDAIGRDLVAMAPDRLLWGSDWPHIMAPLDGWAVPDDAALLDLLLDWAPDPAVRDRILVANPATLFGF